MSAEDVIEFREGCGSGPGFLVARNWGKCKNCKLLDTSSRETFPDGTIRHGSCVAHPIQPNGKWDEDRCDMLQYGTGEVNEHGRPLKAFVFSQLDK